MRLARQAVCFGLVGLAATATHVAVGLGAAHAFGWAPAAANVLAFCVALGVSYLGNSLLTFAVTPTRGRFVRFGLLSLAAFALNQGLVMLLTGPAAWSYAASLAVVVVTVPPLTFLLSKRWALA